MYELACIALFVTFLLLVKALFGGVVVAVLGLIAVMAFMWWLLG